MIKLLSFVIAFFWKIGWSNWVVHIYEKKNREEKELRFFSVKRKALFVIFKLFFLLLIGVYSQKHKAISFFFPPWIMHATILQDPLVNLIKNRNISRKLKNLPQNVIVSKNKYSQTCIRRPLLGPFKSGRLGQVVVF